MRPHDSYKEKYGAVQRKIDLAVSRGGTLLLRGGCIQAIAPALSAAALITLPPRAQMRSVAALQASPAATYVSLYKTIIAGRKPEEVAGAPIAGMDSGLDYTEARVWRQTAVLVPARPIAFAAAWTGRLWAGADLIILCLHCCTLLHCLQDDLINEAEFVVSQARF